MSVEVGPGYHVELGGTGYTCKFDSKSALEFTYQQPFVTRQSVATSRSEGEYAQDLVFTQRSFAQGEGQSVMVSGGEQRYLESSDLDISGADGSLKLLKGVELLTGGPGQPDPGDYSVLLEPSFDGVYLLFPAGSGVLKQLWKWNGSAWVGSAPLAASNTGSTSFRASGMVMCKGYLWVCFDSATPGFGYIVRVNSTGAGFSTFFNSSVQPQAIGTDGTSIFVAYPVAGPGTYEYTKIYTISQTADSRTAVSGDLDGTVVSIKEHAGTMYAIANINPLEQSFLYRYDGTNFVLWKSLPDGFVASSLRSDGSSLYIGGKQKCAEGNYRGQLYYLSGSSSSEALGNLAAFGERDGTSNYDVLGIRAHGKSVYFPWGYYGGLGRFDALTGGISRSYRKTDLDPVWLSEPSSLVVYNGGIYFGFPGSADIFEDTKIFRVVDDTYVESGDMKTSYADFGLPATQKLFTSVTLCLTSALTGATIDGDVAIYYSIDGDTQTWTLLEDSVAGLDPDSDSGGMYQKYTVHLPSNGIKAHSLACELVISSSDDSTTSPTVSWLSTNAMTLLRPPGSTEPRRMWHFNLVLARDTGTAARAREDAHAKLAGLRTLYEAQAVTTLETVADKGTSYNVLIQKVSELAAAYSDKHGYEATVEVECLEVV